MSVRARSSVHVLRAALVVLVLLLPLQQAAALVLDLVRDTISTSVPGAAANHAIEFTLEEALPASGKIVIYPDPGTFDLTTGLALGDIDLSVATSGAYTDRVLAAAASATEDGVTIVSGSSGSITFTLSSGSGIAAGEHVRVELGTIATFGAVGSSTPANPTGVASYRVRIKTTTAGGSTIDSGTAMFAIVPAVAVSGFPLALAPVRFNGLPQGTIAANSSSVELYIQTADYARCRYSETPNTLYANMTNTFGLELAKGFSKVLSGLQNDTTYTYYVRCASANGTANDDDYVISFTLDPTPDSNTSIEGSGVIGRGGAGDFPNGSSVLFLASVTLTGWTAPASTVRVLQDGVQAGSVTSKSDGSFRAEIRGLERGVYTFVMTTTDGKQRASSPLSTTLTLGAGTTNSISDLVSPPTIALPDSVGLGEDAIISGSAVPGSVVELVISPRSSSATGGEHTYAATSSPQGSASAGEWQIIVPARDLAKGTYVVRGRTVITSERKSDYGGALFLGVGEVLTDSQKSALGRSDLNRDGKVNLVDFSILLTSWGDAGIGDINEDGTVNLADFSIMLFDWTG